LPFLSCGSFVAAMAITTGVLMVGAMALWVFARQFEEYLPN
jgi:hypothetical protein